MDQKLHEFLTLITEINISKYDQTEYAEIVNLIYSEIFGGK
jgi:hypothetical protein